MMNFDKIIRIGENSQLIKALLYPVVVVRRLGLTWRESIQDSVLDNLCEILDGDPVIRVDEFHGIFNVGCRSDLFRLMVKNKKYEPELAQCCLNYLNRDRDVIDIGANIGFFTILFAKELRERKVLAIEPTPRTLSFLYTNAQLNNVRERVIIFEGVASNKVGEADIHTVVGKEEYSSLGVMQHPRILKDTPTTIKVQSTMVDRLVEEHSLDPGFIKLDVEGMEHVVLEGMQGVLSDKRPVILSELTAPLLEKNGSSVADVLQFIKKYNYDIVDPLFRKMAPGRRKFGEILCLPR